MSVIYHVKRPDLKHPCAGHWISISGCFEDDGLTGPYHSFDQAAIDIRDNAERLIELYGEEAAVIRDHTNPSTKWAVCGYCGGTGTDPNTLNDSGPCPQCNG